MSLEEDCLGVAAQRIYHRGKKKPMVANKISASCSVPTVLTPAKVLAIPSAKICSSSQMPRSTMHPQQPTSHRITKRMISLILVPCHTHKKKEEDPTNNPRPK